MTKLNRIRIGTRKSPLALAQSEEVSRLLKAAFPALEIEIVPMTTTGDRIQHKTLGEIGGKGLFTKEIEDALFEQKVDIAVHSMKDMPTRLPEGLIIASILPRENPRDVLLTRDGTTLEKLKEGSVIGTSSLRRAAQILHGRPDLKVVPLRGNVQTRLSKLDAEECDATLLAKAGLNRLGMKDLNEEILSIATMLPAVAQGAIGIECRAEDDGIIEYLHALNDYETEICITAERAMLAKLDGSCRTPIAGYAKLDGKMLILDGLIAKPDGSILHRVDQHGPASPEGARQLGEAVGKALADLAGADFLSAPTEDL